jgi:YfiH family protein
MFFEKVNTLFIGRFAELDTDPTLIHGVSTRRGGVSTGPFTSLNLGFKTLDKTDRVRENRRRFFNSVSLSAEMLAVPQQVHSDQVMCVSLPGIVSETDALITKTPGIVLSIQIADCLPIYLYDSENVCIGLVHAGCRGSAISIASKTVQYMNTCFGSNPENIRAFLGPSIGPCCYRVGSDVVSQFSKNYISGTNLNLWKCNSEQLMRCGVKSGNIIISRLCTVCHSDLFFSHRGSGNHTGRMIAFFGIRDKELDILK